MNVNVRVHPAILIFDLDETLFSAAFNGTASQRLCNSAQNLLSDSITDPNGINIMKAKQGDIVVRAIAREAIANIFFTIEFINTQLKRSVIQIKIITKSNYPINLVLDIFDQFYGDASKKFAHGKFPIEYFNRNDLSRNTLIFDSSIKTKNNISDSCKFDIISANYERWAKELPGLKKDRVVLIDNADTYLWPFKGQKEEEKFRALHYATTPGERLKGQTFTEAYPLVMSEITKLICTAVEKVSS